MLYLWTLLTRNENNNNNFYDSCVLLPSLCCHAIMNSIWIWTMANVIVGVQYNNTYTVLHHIYPTCGTCAPRHMYIHTQTKAIFSSYQQLSHMEFSQVDFQYLILLLLPGKSKRSKNAVLWSIYSTSNIHVSKITNWNW